MDGHRWVAAEPGRSGFDLWGHQDDTPEIVYLGSDANEAQLEKLADEFLLGDPEIVNPAFLFKGASGTLSRMKCKLSPSEGGRTAIGEISKKTSLNIALE
jgi:hypothetical protein